MKATSFNNPQECFDIFWSKTKTFNPQHGTPKLESRYLNTCPGIPPLIDLASPIISSLIFFYFWLSQIWKVAEGMRKKKNHPIADFLDHSYSIDAYWKIMKNLIFCCCLQKKIFAIRGGWSDMSATIRFFLRIP